MRVLSRILALLLFLLLLFALCFLAMPKTPHKVGFYAVAFDGKLGEFVDVNKISRYDLRRFNPFLLRIYQAKNTYNTINISSSGSLGSPEFFNSSTAQTIDKEIFDFNIKIAISLKLQEEQILNYLNSKKMTIDNVDNFYASQENKLKSLAKSFIEELVVINNGNLGNQVNNQSQFEALLLAHIKKEMSDFDVDSVVVEQMKLPNFALYKQMLDISLSNLVSQNSAKQAVQKAMAENYANLEERLKILEEYGKVLTQYPVLVPFFMANNSKAFSLAEIQSLMPSSIVNSGSNTPPTTQTTQTTPSSSINNSENAKAK